VEADKSGEDMRQNDFHISATDLDLRSLTSKLLYQLFLTWITNLFFKFEQ